MTTLNLTLPNSIQRHLQEMADLDGVPVNQFVMSAVVEKISALTAETYLRQSRRTRRSRRVAGNSGQGAAAPTRTRRRMTGRFEVSEKTGQLQHSPWMGRR